MRACGDMAVFDAVVNNADRKIGHLLPVADGHRVRLRPRRLLLRGVQAAHRPVAVAGQDPAEALLEALRRLNAQLNEDGLETELASLLTASEINATKIRVETLLKHRVHPYPALRLARHPLAPRLGQGAVRGGLTPVAGQERERLP